MELLAFLRRRNVKGVNNVNNAKREMEIIKFTKTNILDNGNGNVK